MTYDPSKTLIGWTPPPPLQTQQPYPAQPPYPSAPPPTYYAGAYPAYPVHVEEPVAATGPEAPQATPPSQRPLRSAVGAPERVRFIRLTYLHLLFAILAFAGLEYLLMTNPVLDARVSQPLVRFAFGARWNWGIVLAAFMAISWLADAWASHAKSKFVQYVGLALYVCAEALIFVPLLTLVAAKTQMILARGGAEPHIIRDAGLVTVGVFVMLTLSVFISKKDFSFLRSGLLMAGGAALTLIYMSIGFGFNLGLAFSVAMVLVAAAYILYQTSQVLAHYPPRSHVAAALALFSSVALMFWYVIRIFMRRN
jgi:FtsH-binding integral membrane protein